MVEVSKEFIKDLIDSIEWTIKEEGVPEGSSLPEVLKEAKKYIGE
tara:strand:+ start:388 stop:522 length:135 start_codon:yes stop_codon:yes gene_type:complete